jgi:hypothetical protein
LRGIQFKFKFKSRSEICSVKAFTFKITLNSRSELYSWEIFNSNSDSIQDPNSVLLRHSIQIQIEFKIEVYCWEIFNSNSTSIQDRSILFERHSIQSRFKIELLILKGIQFKFNFVSVSELCSREILNSNSNSNSIQDQICFHERGSNRIQVDKLEMKSRSKWIIFLRDKSDDSMFNSSKLKGLRSWVYE